MTDIIARLRGPAPSIPAMRDAADEISLLRQRVSALESALQPFATEFMDWTGVGCWDDMTVEDMYSHAPGENAGITFGDLRRAASLLEKK
ncbi:hypothetical protein RE432_15105 [Pusillimonas sp. SM2304]|uniref:hypothetical protein n=1 Tax=Pusillimonas sp. SM2304 TaxID=3073241 RepID=UPI002875BF85|nr:hypothetical protein [Pusillimonas sp. SM2304]MDS1141768.1 hypothetical protein [Pusillimonas sp. SM2304]